MKQEFKDYLENYLREHGFGSEEVPSGFTDDRASTAARTFADYTRNGADGLCAREVAMRDLFADVGDSRLETSRNFLEDYFGNRFSDLESIEPLALELSGVSEIWDPFQIELGLGLDGNMVEERVKELRERIDQFLKSNGI